MSLFLDTKINQESGRYACWFLFERIFVWSGRLV